MTITPSKTLPGLPEPTQDLGQIAWKRKYFSEMPRVFGDRRWTMEAALEFKAWREAWIKVNGEYPEPESDA